MTIMFRSITVLTTIALFACVSGAADVTFTEKPSVTSAGGAVKIAFAVSASTDVEVAVLSADGKIVRHLAAGVLGGKKAPPAPLKPGLAQQLVWDGKDDAGQNAGGRPFSVRVRIGAAGKFGRVIGDPSVIGDAIYGLATDEKGNLYVASGGVYSSQPVLTIKVFDRKGAYLRTVLPMPASLKPGQVAAFGKSRRIDGRLTPENHGLLVPYVQPGGVTAFVGNTIRDGVLRLVNTAGRLCSIRTDGSAVAWAKAPKAMSPSGGPMCWAVGKDALYMTGWWNRRSTQSKGKIKPEDGRIFKVDPATGNATEFARIDVPADSYWLKETNGWYHFKNWARKNGCAAMHGMVVDKGGRLIVCDRVNQRLAVYSTDGKCVGETKIDWPDLVALSPRDKTVYVTTRKIIDGYKAINEFRVVKLSAAVDGKVLAETTLRGKNAPSMALDATADPAVIWLSNVGKEGEAIVRVEDRGKSFAVTGRLNEGMASPGGIVRAWVDPESDTVYASNGWSGLSRYDGLAGTGTALKARAMDMTIGPDGYLYLYGQKGWNEPIYRCDKDFNPVPFAGTGKPTTGKTSAGREVYGRYGMGWSNKGIAVTPDGWIFVRSMYDWNKYFVTVFDSDGKAETHGRVSGGIIGPLDNYTGGIKIDREGYFYLGTSSSPASGRKPHKLKGCIVKVKPSGGGVVKKKTGEDGIAFHGYFFEGAVNVYGDLAPRAYTGCCCKEGQFDLDGYGRLYVPDTVDFCVRIYDNAGNLITKFGHYANTDTAGPGSLIPKPGIGLGWPMSCSVNKAGRMYIADVLNQRLVRVDLTPTAEATAKID